MDSRIKTYRKSFTPNAVVYKYAVQHVIDRLKHNILDFGSGKDRYWEMKLAKECYGIDSFDLSIKDRTMRNNYEVILLSNVLNVQETEDQLDSTIHRVLDFAKSGTQIIWNYPKAPRKMSLSSDEMLDKLVDKSFLRSYSCFTEKVKLYPYGENTNLYLTVIV
jgi:hypothetical protein